MHYLRVIPGEFLRIAACLQLLLLLSGCYKEEIDYPLPANRSLDFVMTVKQEELVHTVSQNIEILNPSPVLLLPDRQLDIDHFRIRGESSLRYYRKSFSVNMDDDLFMVDTDNGIPVSFEKYKLISLVFDYTYLEHAIACNLLERIGLWPLFRQYTEVTINGNTQGLYLFVEDPEEYLLYTAGAPIVLRRHYHHELKAYSVNEVLNPYPQLYLSRFSHIYDLITQYTGETLYDSLSAYVDMTAYFRKMSLDMLVGNGDLTDEVFLYPTPESGGSRFAICPWDYDDIFEEYPHEIGRAWAVGQVFGTRTYNSMEDVIADVGDKLVFSIEDDLDYIIARDDILYHHYLGELMWVLDEIGEEEIVDAFKEAENLLEPFYRREEMIAMSQYDEDATNLSLFRENLEEKQNWLIHRRKELAGKLQNTGL